MLHDRHLLHRVTRASGACARHLCLVTLGAALCGLVAAAAPRPAGAIPVFMDITYNAVPGVGDSNVGVSAYFDDGALTGVGHEAVTLSSLVATITSARFGLNAHAFHLPNTDVLCRRFPGVACFASTPYQVHFRNGAFQGLSGTQGLHGTSSGSSNYPVNGSILFQLGFNRANSFGPLAHVRYARATEHVHDSLQASVSVLMPVTASAPAPATVALLAAGLLAATATARRRAR